MASYILETADLRDELAKAHADKLIAEVHTEYPEGKRKSKKYNTAIKEAINLGKAEATRILFDMDEYNGVRNPAADDDAWGRGAGHVPDKPAPTTIKANKYAGKCPTCDIWVGAGAGKLVKVAGKWGAEHITCPEATEVAEAPKGLDLSGIQSGYYAVPDGDTRLKVRIAHGKEGSKWEGYTFVTDGAEYGQQVRYGTQRPDASYNGKIEAQLQAIADNPQEAMRAYGRLVGQCGSCGRKLENEASIEAGIGAICEGKGMFA